MNRNSSPLAGAGLVVGGCVACVLILWALIAGIGKLSARWTPQPGQIGVVRAGSSALWIGDWFKGHDIKEIVSPGSGNTDIGLGSIVHAYPADSVQRTYTITADPNQGDQTGVDYVQVPTSDGINVSLEGTFYFTTGFNGTAPGEKLVKDFDNRFGVRTFNPNANSANQLHAYDGNAGWESFLNTVIRPIIDNDLRQEIGKYTCAQLQSACALVYNANAHVGAANNNQTLTQIQNAINASLEADVKSTLGQDYFSQVSFRLSRVTLPGTIQTEIEKAQAQFAAVGTAKAEVQQAQQQAQANEERQRGYALCPACAAIDELKAIPSNVTVYAPGGNTAVPLTASK